MYENLSINYTFCFVLQFYHGSKNGSETMDERIPADVNIHCLDLDYGLLSPAIGCQLHNALTDLDHRLVFDAVQFDRFIWMYNYDKSKFIFV